MHFNPPPRVCVCACVFTFSGVQLHSRGKWKVQRKCRAECYCRKIRCTSRSRSITTRTVPRLTSRSCSTRMISVSISSSKFICDFTPFFHYRCNTHKRHTERTKQSARWWRFFAIMSGHAWPPRSLTKRRSIDASRRPPHNVDRNRIARSSAWSGWKEKGWRFAPNQTPLERTICYNLLLFLVPPFSFKLHFWCNSVLMLRRGPAARLWTEHDVRIMSSPFPFPRKVQRESGGSLEARFGPFRQPFPAKQR